jgi:hypothetical protein
MELPPVVASVDDLREAVSLACQTSPGRKMLRGRAQVLSAPRAWVLAQIGRVAEDAIDWGDFWDYRRLLELYTLLDPSLLPRTIERGLTSVDPDVREAAEDFRDAAYIESTRVDLTRGLTEMYPELGRLLGHGSDRLDSVP